jgi:hypothetical protein
MLASMRPDVLLSDGRSDLHIPSPDSVWLGMYQRVNSFRLVHGCWLL